MFKSIRAKLGLGFALLIVLAVIVGGLGLGNAKEIRETMTNTTSCPGV